jgi:DNA-binding transcriptional LysR family regulator
VDSISVTNIPTEIIRSFVVIADTGSLSKAGDALGLSQPAISAQMKRLQVLIGGQVLSKTSAGTTISELGKLVLEQARRILEAHDQMLLFAGGGSANAPLRVGISALMLPTFLAPGFQRSGHSLFAAHSREIRKGLIEGYIDVGCLFTSSGDESQIADLIVERQGVPMSWVRSPDFVLNPGDPIPVISLPEDDYIIRPLRGAKLSYRIVLNSPDMFAREAAIRAGLGIGVVPSAIAPADLIQTEEYCLPKMAALDAYICVRASLDEKKAKSIMPQLQTTLRTFGGGTVK